MSYIDFLISSFLFFIIFFSLVIFINNKIIEIKKEKEIIELREEIFKKLEKIKDKIFSNFYYAIFYVNGSNTIFLNFSVDCNWKININSIRVFMNDNELPYSIENYNLCLDNSLNFINISVNLPYAVQNQEIKVYFSSENITSKSYSFSKVFSPFSYSFVGFGNVLVLNTEKLKNYSELRDAIGNSFKIEIFENEKVYSFGEKEYGNVFSIIFPIYFFNETIKKGEFAFKIFE